jgi:hypothetical protein
MDVFVQMTVPGKSVIRGSPLLEIGDVARFERERDDYYWVLGRRFIQKIIKATSLRARHPILGT